MKISELSSLGLKDINAVKKITKTTDSNFEEFLKRAREGLNNAPVTSKPNTLIKYAPDPTAQQVQLAYLANLKKEKEDDEVRKERESKRKDIESESEQSD